MLVLSSVLLALAILNWEHLRLGYVTLRQNPGFYLLDALVTLFVVFEVAIRMTGHGKRCVSLRVAACRCVPACLRACVPACLRACVPACLRACVPACLRACVPACLRAGEPASL